MAALVSFTIMPMRVVRIGHMRVGVAHRFMSVQVTVGA